MTVTAVSIQAPSIQRIRGLEMPWNRVLSLHPARRPGRRVPWAHGIRRNSPPNAWRSSPTPGT